MPRTRTTQDGTEVHTSDLAGRLQALEEHAAGRSWVDVAEVADVPAADLRLADEHDVMLTLVLAALCARMGGGPSIAPVLAKAAERYVSSSFLYTGRILPWAGELIELLDRGVDERSPALLTEAADHLSQGWPGYAHSGFPAAFTRLARELGLGMTAEQFFEVSFVSWQRGLAAAGAGDAEQARAHFETSLDRYRAYRYYADAAWLFTDLVIAHLLAGHEDRAAATARAQRAYVDDILATHPLVEDTEDEVGAFHLGDVRSGSYGTFIESTTLRPAALTHRDAALLRRYTRTSEHLLAACRFGARRELDAALDVFTCGWSTFQTSPYPKIFLRLADRYTDGRHPWNPHLTAYECWHRMLRTYRIRVKPRHLIDTATTLHDRFTYAGLPTCAATVLLDAALLQARLHGRNGAVEWVSRYLQELRPVVPELVQAAARYLQVPQGTEFPWQLGTYRGLRPAHLAPEFPGPGLGDTPLPEADRFEFVLYGPLLSLEGVTLYDSTPRPLADILRALGEEFTRTRPDGGEVPFLSAAELARRVNRTPSAIAQAVRRFRHVCQETLRETAEHEIVQDAVIQGRPGYRINPAKVQRFLDYSLSA
ncbi:hypothetical protein ICC28_36645 [Streptomyces sp. TRM68416]|nr:hypothetical protein [Streptomyces sp. TRM68416]MBD0844179.1 hypothetical protein [Streptomyces sp. TRM68416]